MTDPPAKEATTPIDDEPRVIQRRWPAILIGLSAGLIVNVPLILILTKYEGSVSISMFFYAPNQFWYLPFFFPVQVYLLSRAIQILGISRLQDLKEPSFLAVRARKYMPWFVGIALILSGFFTYLDYQSSEAADHYQLTPLIAKASVQARKVFLQHI